MKMTHRVIRARDELTLREFRNRSTARAWMQKVKARFSHNKYRVEEKT